MDRIGQKGTASRPPVGFKQTSKCKASAGPRIGLREGSKAVLGIVSTHAQRIVCPTAQCACPTHRKPHNAEKMPSFLTSMFPKIVGITSSSKAASVSRRQTSYNVAGDHALCTRQSRYGRQAGAPQGH